MTLVIGTISAIIAASVTVSKALAVVGLAVQGLKVIGNAIASIAKALGIIKPERDVEEIGDRALQAEEKGMTPDKYSSYEAWVKAIDDDDWGYDPEKNVGITPEQKISKGVEVASAATIEKFPSLPIQEFLSLAGSNLEFFTLERMYEVSKLASGDPDAFGKIVNYVTGVAKDHTTVDSATQILMDIEKVINPGVSDNAAYDTVARFKDMK